MLRLRTASQGEGENAETDAAAGRSWSAWASSRARFSPAAALGLSLDASPRALARRGVPGVSTIRVDAAIVAATVLINLLALAMPLGVLQIYDRIAPAEARATLIALCAGLVAVALFEFALRALQGYLIALNAARFHQTLQIEALRRMLAAPGERPERRPQEALENFTAIERLSEYYGGQGRLALIELPFAAIFFLVIATIGGWLVLVPLTVFLMFLGAIWWIGRRTKALTEERTRQDGKMLDFTSEALSNVVTVKAFGVEPMILRRYERLVKSLAGQQMRLVALTGDSQRLSSFFGNLNVVATLGAGAVLLAQGSLTVGGLAACSMLSARAIQPLLRASRAWSETQRAAVAATRVTALFEGAPPAAEASVFRPTTAARSDEPAFHPPATLEASGLTIQPGEAALVADAAFRVEPGSLVAVTGPDGSGRSSFLAITAGFAAPAAGRVTINGEAPETFRLTRDGAVCLASTRERLFSGSILENLTLFGLGPSVDDARWAARLLGLEDAVGRLPNGYDTQVAVGANDPLAAGLTRCVLLARAIARRPSLLLLDDPHAFLDLETREAIERALLELRGRMTILVVTAQSDFVRRCDQVLAFGDGRIRDLSPFATQGSPVRAEPADEERADEEWAQEERAREERAQEERAYEERAHVERAHVERAVEKQAAQAGPVAPAAQVEVRQAAVGAAVGAARGAQPVGGARAAHSAPAPAPATPAPRRAAQTAPMKADAAPRAPQKPPSKASPAPPSRERDAALEPRGDARDAGSGATPPASAPDASAARPPLEPGVEPGAAAPATRGEAAAPGKPAGSTGVSGPSPSAAPRSPTPAALSAEETEGPAAQTPGSVVANAPATDPAGPDHGGSEARSDRHGRAPGTALPAVSDTRSAMSVAAPSADPRRIASSPAVGPAEARPSPRPDPSETAVKTLSEGASSRAGAAASPKPPGPSGVSQPSASSPAAPTQAQTTGIGGTGDGPQASGPAASATDAPAAPPQPERGAADARREGDEGGVAAAHLGQGRGDAVRAALEALQAVRPETAARSSVGDADETVAPRRGSDGEGER